MPRVVDFRIAAIARLHRELAYAPTEARRRQMEACERLVAEIDPRRAYPVAFVIYRITGFRPAGVDEGELLAGEALVADLCAFVQRLSAGLGLRSSERPGGALPLDELAANLGVTVRTVQRWRRLGLLLHEIVFDHAPSTAAPAGRPRRGTPPAGRERDERVRLGCFDESLRAFRARHPDLFDARRGASRLTPPERAAIIDEARAARAAAPRSLNAVAGLLAARRGRAAETIRRILVSHDARSSAPIFLERGPLDERDRRFIERAWRRGVPLLAVGARLGRSAPAIHRQLALRRAELLRGLELRWHELATFALPDAAEVILAAAPASRGLVRLRERRDALALLRELDARPPADDARREAQLAAYGFLKRRAARAIAALRMPPRTGDLDAIETDLRWAALFKHLLASEALPTALRRVEALAGRAIERLPAEEIRSAIARCVPVVSDSIERVDPSRDQRLDRVVALDVDKVLARGGAAVRRVRAGAAHAAGSVPIDDPLAALCAWQAWLDPPGEWAARIELLPELPRRAVQMHHGLAGEPPRTLRQVAKALRVGSSAAARLVRDGEATLRARR